MYYDDNMFGYETPEKNNANNNNNNNSSNIKNSQDTDAILYKPRSVE